MKKTHLSGLLFGVVLTFTSQNSYSATTAYLTDAPYNTNILKIDSELKKFELIDSCRLSKIARNRDDVIISIKGDYTEQNVKGYGKAKIAKNLKISMKGKTEKMSANSLFDAGLGLCSSTESILKYFENQKEKNQSPSFKFTIYNESISLVNTDNNGQYDNGQSIDQSNKLKNALVPELNELADLDFTMSLIKKMTITYHKLIIEGAAGGSTSDSGVGSFGWSGGEVGAEAFNFFSNMMGRVAVDLSTKFEKSKFYDCKVLVDKYEKAPSQYSALQNKNEKDAAEEFFGCLIPKLKIKNYNPFDYNA